MNTELKLVKAKVKQLSPQQKIFKLFSIILRDFSADFAEWFSYYAGERLDQETQQKIVLLLEELVNEFFEDYVESDSKSVFRYCALCGDVFILDDYSSDSKFCSYQCRDIYEGHMKIDTYVFLGLESRHCIRCNAVFADNIETFGDDVKIIKRYRNQEEVISVKRYKRCKNCQMVYGILVR